MKGFLKMAFCALVLLFLYGILMNTHATYHAVLVMCEQTGAINCFLPDGG
jgi:hypothetical protein